MPTMTRLWLGLAAFALATGCRPEPKPIAPIASEPSSPRAPELEPSSGSPPNKVATDAPDQPAEEPVAERKDVREAGDRLVVHSPPRSSTRSYRGRMRSHVDGTLSAGHQRIWVGPEVPTFVELAIGRLELFILDPAPGGETLAFYREPYNKDTCPLGSSGNCRYSARLHRADGSVAWTIELDKLLSRRKHLEIQDIRYSDGVLLFNEACQSYSKEAKGKCSALVAVDPTKPGKPLWRTRPLVSNNRFHPLADYVLTGYGFTAERDYLYLVRRRDGKVVHRVRVPSAPEEFEPQEDGTILVHHYSGALRVRLDGLGGSSPRIRKLPRK